MNVSLSVTGAEEIDAVLRGLPLLYTHRVLQAAHADAAKPMIERERSLAPRRSGRLAKSVGSTKPAFSKASIIGEVLVGPKRGRFGGNHGHFPEFGTKPRVTRSGAYRGIMPTKPYARPAFEQTNRQVINGISLSLGKKTLAFMRRIIKKNG